MEVSLCLHPEVRVSIRQGFFCGKVSAKCWINIMLVRCANVDVALAIVLSAPVIRCNEEYTLCVYVIKSRSRRIGPTAVAYITLPRLAHLCSYVVSTAL